VKATKVNAGLAESNGRLLLGIWRDSLHVTCGLTACTPGSAPGPTLGNEYGKTLPFTFTSVCRTVRSENAIVQIRHVLMNVTSANTVSKAYETKTTSLQCYPCMVLFVALVCNVCCESTYGGGLWSQVRLGLVHWDCE